MAMEYSSSRIAIKESIPNESTYPELKMSLSRIDFSELSRLIEDSSDILFIMKSSIS